MEEINLSCYTYKSQIKIELTDEQLVSLLKWFKDNNINPIKMEMVVSPKGNWDSLT